MKNEYIIFSDGIVICGDCNDSNVFDFIKNYLNGEKVAAVITDPPYGNVLKEKWDKTNYLKKSLLTGIMKS